MKKLRQGIIKDTMAHGRNSAGLQPVGLLSAHFSTLGPEN
jgi:hypothetical protein